MIDATIIRRTGALRMIPLPTSRVETRWSIAPIRGSVSGEECSAGLAHRDGLLRLRWPRSAQDCARFGHTTATGSAGPLVELPIRSGRIRLATGEQP